MPEAPLKVMAVIGSLKQNNSVTRTVIRYTGEQLTSRGCAVDILDLLEEPLPLYNPETAYRSATFRALRQRVDQADAFVLGTPDYHGSISSAMKNFLDHFWYEFSGKLMASVVASHEKGLTVADQLRTIARQCYAWSLPYTVSCIDKEEVHNGDIVSTQLRQRLEMFVRDVAVYGRLLAVQRAADLAGTDPGLMARHRKKAAAAD